MHSSIILLIMNSVTGVLIVKSAVGFLLVKECRTTADSEQCHRTTENTNPAEHHETERNHANSHNENSYDMCVATIEGQAFLWHQVRAIMAILFLIGDGKENPSIVRELLNVEKHPRKPQYCLASDLPLNLYRTSFPGIGWQISMDTLNATISHLQGLWTQYNIQATMIRRMLCDLEDDYETNQSSSKKIIRHQYETLVPGAKTKIYRPLLSRPMCESLETRVEHYIKKGVLKPELKSQVSDAATSD
ncbi:tRNA pseudouridine synthase 3 [Halocaridina rubra]|uniref:tRNA pseudouridine synthase n=1 Tax=Halocaridina rubra TaxID=373956 RepID=A0AAN8X8F8_HALRR